MTLESAVQMAWFPEAAISWSAMLYGVSMSFAALPLAVIAAALIHIRLSSWIKDLTVGKVQPGKFR